MVVGRGRKLGSLVDWLCADKHTRTHTYPHNYSTSPNNKHAYQQNVTYYWHFLFTCSRTFVVGCIVCTQCTESQADRRTDRQTDDSIMPAADHTALKIIGDAR